MVNEPELSHPTGGFLEFPTHRTSKNVFFLLLWTPALWGVRAISDPFVGFSKSGSRLFGHHQYIATLEGESSDLCSGFPLVSFGFLWFPLVSFGFPWFPLVSFGCFWLLSNCFKHIWHF